MKILFNETLQDKKTGAYYYNGTIHEFTEERGKEILSSGRAVKEYIEEVALKATSVDVASEATNDETLVNTKSIELVNIETLTLAELKACAKDLGLKVTGTKAELIERITGLK